MRTRADEKEFDAQRASTFGGFIHDVPSGAGVEQFAVVGRSSERA
jgi:hypothetical protein